MANCNKWVSCALERDGRMGGNIGAYGAFMGKAESDHLEDMVADGVKYSCVLLIV